MKKTLYPKTKRIWDQWYVITEKMDGSNLWLFRLWWELIIAQRNYVYKFSEIEENKGIVYKGLYWRLQENIDKLDFHDWSGVFWEWIGMWKIKYWDIKKFHIFAKANINEDYDIRNLNYQQELFIYPFVSQEIPSCMDVVAIIRKVSTNPYIKELDELYDDYCSNLDRPCEWFVIHDWVNAKKYVRYKNLKKTKHKS